MWTKGLLAITFLAGLSATAQAGSTITDKSYWPNEARRSVQVGASVPQRDPYAAFAYSRGASENRAAFVPMVGGSAWRYQGGRKSR
jgi:hypothetical protein